MFIQLIPDFTPNTAGTSALCDGCHRHLPRSTGASGAVCYISHTTKRPTDPGVVSTGIFIEGEGALELSMQIVEEMGALFGMLTAEKAADLVKKNREFGRRAQVAEDRLKKNDTIATLLAEMK